MYVFFAFALTSCYSTLKVKVDVIDMEKLKQSREYKAEIREAQLNDFNVKLLSGFFNKTKAIVSKKVAESLPSDTTFDKNDIPAVMKLIDDSLSKRSAVRVMLFTTGSSKKPFSFLSRFLFAFSSCFCFFISSVFSAASFSFRSAFHRHFGYRLPGYISPRFLIC